MRLTVTLDMEGDAKDKEAVKESVYAYLRELEMEYESLEFEIEEEK